MSGNKGFRVEAWLVRKYLLLLEKNLFMATASNKPKNVKLRAFRIENDDPKKSNSGLLALLQAKLEASKVKDRKMLLNQDDPRKEEDLICDYSPQNKDFLSGTILRIMASSDLPSIPDNLFDKAKIVINDLDELAVGSSSVYKDHYYFLLNNNYVIISLLGTTITRFQTYINWYLNPERGSTLFQFTPLTVLHESIKMEDLRSIKVQDPIVSSEQGKNSEVGSKKIKDISRDFILQFIQDVKGLKDIELDKIISAELLIKFKKPKGMDKEEYQKILGAYMKPISDTDNVIFIPKKGSAIKGSEILKEKNVDIELTESGKLSEPQLLQEMEKFLSEIQNEKVD